MKFAHFKEKYVRDVFDVSIILKGIEAILETVSGFILFFVSTTQLNAVVNFFTQAELVEDPHDAIANYLTHTFQSLAGPTKFFGAMYLIAHGIVKVGLVAGLLRNRLWAYPAAIVIFVLFGLYQLYYLLQGYSFWLTALTVLDAIVIALTWHEYRYRKAHGLFVK